MAMSSQIRRVRKAATLVWRNQNENKEMAMRANKLGKISSNQSVLKKPSNDGKIPEAAARKRAREASGREHGENLPKALKPAK